MIDKTESITELGRLIVSNAIMASALYEISTLKNYHTKSDAKLIALKTISNIMRCDKSKIIKTTNDFEIELYSQNEIWNAAIELAALWLETTDRNNLNDAEEIRKFKK